MGVPRTRGGPKGSSFTAINRVLNASSHVRLPVPAGQATPHQVREGDAVQRLEPGDRVQAWWRVCAAGRGRDRRGWAGRARRRRTMKLRVALHCTHADDTRGCTRTHTHTGARREGAGGVGKRGREAGSLQGALPWPANAVAAARQQQPEPRRAPPRARHNARTLREPGLALGGGVRGSSADALLPVQVDHQPRPAAATTTAAWDL